MQEMSYIDMDHNIQYEKWELISRAKIPTQVEKHLGNLNEKITINEFISEYIATMEELGDKVKKHQNLLRANEDEKRIFENELKSAYSSPQK